MKKMTVTLSLLAVASGTTGAAIAYASTAPDPATQSSISAPPPAAKAAVATRHGVKLRVRFRTCRAGAQLEHGKCVRHVLRTVVDPAPDVTAVSSSASNRSTGRSNRENGDRLPKVRPSASEHPDDQTDVEKGHESESSEDHASGDTPETDG